MTKNLGWKLVLIFGTLAVFLFGIFGVPSGLSGSALATAIQNRIHLGLDLKGGTHLILQVQVNDAVNADSDRAVERLKDRMRARKINFTEVSKSDPANNPDKIVITGVPPENSADLRSLVGDQLPEYNLNSGAANTWTVAMKPPQLTELKSRAVQQAIETIRNRIDKLGISEPIIQEHGLGQYQILVELPGVDDPARVKEIMQSTAMLEIRQALNNGQPYPSQDAALQANGGVLPPNSVLLPGRSIGTGENAEGEVYYLISRTSAVAGHDLREARVSRNSQTNMPEVEFFLTAEGGRRFSEFTGAHVGDYLSVILDNKVMEVAVIKSQIGDTGVIEGRFTDQQARDLALILNSGALPATIKYLQESTVGPSLGNDSIRAGVRAAIIGMAAVLLFMLVYYHGAGINADVALILNLIILLGFMGYFGATLTLPGIAGVILTVGMGVDSNVLIFERIREELRNGKTPPSAVDQGFSHAWVTIVDTHVTTIVSAAILFIFGTGPVKGFAVTLTFGLLANLFTAVFVSRVIFDWVLSRKQRGEALSIG
ncbi:MAG: protein translocase subunit SecD [Acidobacteria bacterium]|nr:protein translocase subunit SecD [Acidobacteriota bacterium]MBV8893953.1 protein translocase subunit SecD [Acidobacteriota bacterium]MBV9480890.1 protein translocase subunit SecD [Acidobacteriota bacterium]